MSLNTTTPDTGDHILVTVNATDIMGVTVVEANGNPLANLGGDIWKGTITAVEGTHSVNVSAKDDEDNIAWNNDTSYTATISDTDSVYDIFFLPPITTRNTFNLKNGRTLPIKFTVRDNVTGDFIYDDTVNLTITNSKGHLIDYFTNGKGKNNVRINPTEEHYIVNFHTKDYTLNVGKEYTINVIFAEQNNLKGYEYCIFQICG